MAWIYCRPRDLVDANLGWHAFLRLGSEPFLRKGSDPGCQEHPRMAWIYGLSVMLVAPSAGVSSASPRLGAMYHFCTTLSPRLNT